MTNGPSRNVLKYHFTFLALGPVYHHKGTRRENLLGGFEMDREQQLGDRKTLL